MPLGCYIVAMDAERWHAVEARQDADFLYAVSTTGVFCRPGCPSRRPRPENVEFFETPGDAICAGYRPCKRCRPMGEGDETVAALVRACRILAEERVTTRQLAGELGWSEGYLSRCFKKHLGVTPQQLARRARIERAREAIVGARSVTETVYEAGYSSSSRFYADVGRELGMAPSVARRRGAGEVICHAVVECSLGALLVAWTERGVCQVGIGEPTELVEALRARFAAAEHRVGEAAWVADVVAAVEHAAPCEVPLDLRGTAFQERVWQALRAIPPGMTSTYGEIAEALGKPRGARAVARACAENPVAVAVPCHRVVGADGALRGYRWGGARKAELLRRERGKK